MNITLESVSFAYPGGVKALQGVDLQVEAGESVALIGENGAGKTTLAKHLNGLLKPDTGQVIIGGWNTTDHTVAQMATRVGFVFQNPDDQLFARNVRDEVAFGPRNLGFAKPDVKTCVDQALEWVGLTDLARYHPYDLQAADRKLIALATILAMRTSIIILDEPTMGQDARGLNKIAWIIEQLKNEGRTVLMISHDIDFCAVHFDRVLVMSAGRVVADGATAEVLERQQLLAEANLEPPQLMRLAAALQMTDRPLIVTEFLRAYRAQLDEKE